MFSLNYSSCKNRVSVENAALASGNTLEKELPILLNPKIVTEKIRKGVFKKSLDFFACKNSTETDWKLEYKIDPATGYYFLSAVPSSNVDCSHPYQLEGRQTISIDLKDYPELVELVTVIIMNKSQLDREFID